MMTNLLQDVRYALRQLRKSPGFTITAVLTLALGIGANTAIFTLVHAVLLRNLPVADPKTLIRIGDKGECCVEGGPPKNDDYSLFSYDLYKHLEASAPEFEQMAAMQAGGEALTVQRSGSNGAARSSIGEYVSGNYFETFGLMPYAGRLMIPSDDRAGASMVAVISYRAWQRDYGLDPSAIGSTFLLNTHPTTIIGVTPPSFYGDRLTDNPVDFYLPFSSEPIMAQVSLLHAESSNWVYLMGRIKPGVELAPLQAKLSSNLRQYLAQLDVYKKDQFQKSLANSHVTLTPGGGGIANMQEQYSSGLHLLMGISALVLLIACANIGNLVLVRGMAGRSETSLRMAIGAGRSRIIRQILTESIVLACIGGLAGVAVSYGGTTMLLALAFPDSPNLPLHATPSLVVLAFAFGVSLLAGLVFGLAPAWITSREDPAEALRGANRSTRDGSSLLQRSLVILQAALSLVLLVGAGLLTKSLSKLEHQNFGLLTDNRYVLHINPEAVGYKPDQLQPLEDAILTRLGSLPGVKRAGLGLYAPLEGGAWGEVVYIQGRPEPHYGENSGALWDRVSPQFLDLVGQQVLRGRGITEQDTATSIAVAVVNQTFVKRFFPDGQDPIGVHFGVSGVKSSSDFEIVGVVADAKYQDPRGELRPMYFRPLLQVAHTEPTGDTRSLFAGAIMLQMNGPAEGLEQQVRKTLASINPNLAVRDFESFDEQIEGQFNQDRLIERLTTLFGVLALALASVGLYGVTAYTVQRRTSEIGIRMALGATRGSVVGMVLRQAMLQAGIGLAIGVPVALVCVRFVKEQLYQVAGFDALVLGLAVLALAASACVAGLIPARRAAGIDPMTALRIE